MRSALSPPLGDRSMLSNHLARLQEDLKHEDDPSDEKSCQYRGCEPQAAESGASSSYASPESERADADPDNDVDGIVQRHPGQVQGNGDDDGWNA